MSAMKFQIGYTPTADDAYMFFGLITGAIDTAGWEFEPVENNLPALNDHASRSQYPVTMISAATYPLVRDRYALLSCGGSFSVDSGAVLVSREPITPAQLDDKIIAIPGATTTAYALLQLFKPTLRTRILPLDKLIPAVEAGFVDGAIVIHEEFLSYEHQGLRIIVDLGKWWSQNHSNLPSPVSCCVVRKDVPLDQQKTLASLIRQSIQFSQANHSKAMAHALKYAPNCDPAVIERFVRQHVNDLSLDMGQTGQASLEAFYELTAEAGILPKALPLEIIQPDEPAN